MAHNYDGAQPSRAMRKRSKLGKDGITLARLEELLGTGPGTGNASNPQTLDQPKETPRSSEDSPG